MCRLCGVGFDSEISEEGRRQLQAVRGACVTLLQEVEAVLYSPLQRAQETALALFASQSLLEDAEENIVDPKLEFLPLLCLMEERCEEHLQERGCNMCGGPRLHGGGLTSSPLFLSRIKAFLLFAWECEWKCIALVGHSLWFRSFLALAASPDDHTVKAAAHKVSNASVWKLTLCPPKEGGDMPQLSRIELVAKP